MLVRPVSARPASTENMKHTKEELRSAALDIIFEREKLPTLFYNKPRTLAQAVASLLAKRGKYYDPLKEYPGYELSEDDKSLFDEVFWDLVLDRIIIPGIEIFDVKGSTYRTRSDAKHDAK